MRRSTCTTIILALALAITAVTAAVALLALDSPGAADDAWAGAALGVALAGLFLLANSELQRVGAAIGALILAATGGLAASAYTAEGSLGAEALRQRGAVELEVERADVADAEERESTNCSLVDKRVRDQVLGDPASARQVLEFSPNAERFVTSEELDVCGSPLAHVQKALADADAGDLGPG